MFGIGCAVCDEERGGEADTLAKEDLVYTMGASGHLWYNIEDPVPVVGDEPTT